MDPRHASAAVGLLFLLSSFLLLLVSWQSALSSITGSAVTLCSTGGTTVALPGAEGQAVEVEAKCVGGQGAVAAPQYLGNWSFHCPPGYALILRVSAPLGWPSVVASYSCG